MTEKRPMPDWGVTRMALSLVALAALSTQSLFAPEARGETSRSSQPTESVPAGETRDLRDTEVRNPFAYIVPQCYVLTQDASGSVLNPCYVCHQRGKSPNFLDDSSFQLAYEMTERGLTNPWENLFDDRSTQTRSIGDAEALAYVRASNYLSEAGNLMLAQRLADLPSTWDLDGDQHWDGYRPDAYFRFDEQGFDRDPDNGYTGWRAFAYYPTPGTYWPSNGSAADVLIRLPEPFRRDREGELDPTLYAVNLAIVESLIKRADVAIDPLDENRYAVDLNKDGELGWTNIIRYDWAPLEGRDMSFLGEAGRQQAAGQLHLAAGLFPEGTEFLQSLRYLDVTEDGKVQPAARMKELRYARKQSWYNYAELKGLIDREDGERREYENDTIKQVPGDYERGRFGQGWVYQGFIESRDGSLRPQSQEETLYCMGCHTGLGATTDTTFAFARKLDAGAYRRGWYHWTQKDASGLNEPKVEIDGAGVQYEYAYYLMYTRSGSEFLANPELEARFFDDNGEPRAEAFAALHEDVTLALMPSPERALALNKAYWTIVDDQDFVLGRDANLTPLGSLQAEVTKDLPTGVEQAANPVAFAGCFAQGSACNADGERSPEQNDWAALVNGAGMDGPDGSRYEVDWKGIIHQSSYALGIEGVSFTFPSRLTLPTRTIVPLRDIRVCYECHRISAPVIASEARVELPMDFSALTPEADSEAGLTQLTNHSARDVGAKWSPDGQTLAFVSNRSGDNQIWLLRLSSGETRQLTSGPDQHAWPEWSPDGQRLVYWAFDPTNSAQSLKTIKLDGTAETTIVRAPGHVDCPAWRPDGGYIAAAAEIDDNWDIWIIRPDGSDLRRLTSDPAMETNPLWSPDGTTIAYKVAPSGDYNLTIQNFMTFEHGLDEPTIHVWNGPQAVQMNAWSPDGIQIAYTAEVISGSSGEDRLTYANIVSDLELRDGQAVADPSVIISKGLTIGDRGAVFSPVDANQVAFWAWGQDHRANLWLYDQASDRLEQITQGGSDIYPQWSPDGKHLVFESSRAGSSDLWLLTLE
ncbi:hypothetical protein G3480_01385 [Thiorhodococcus mannitoliphagus]|uniref:Uncharacterized protein n=1 Tax=Thiorhodococcus mannitoliphagus TaxID=329406 RepID=A0A6P1DN64_9GAMM|nr:DPP IV N-terminal domain-containing protein [Thiorhodococcus mannitoliphagus]NEX18980.1 hypothetical protein [Thiorhodococcus mannitoliphagus]